MQIRENIQYQKKKKNVKKLVMLNCAVLKFELI